MRAISALDICTVKNLNPQVAKRLSFLHPTLTAPPKTAIVNGHEVLTRARSHQGKGEENLALRADLQQVQEEG